jgi:PKD repeat protein
MKNVSAAVLAIVMLAAWNVSGWEASPAHEEGDGPPAPLATTLLRGWATDSGNSSPIPGVFVHAEWGSQGQSNDTGTNATGYYEVGVQSGRVSVFFVHQAYYTLIQNFTASGATMWVNASLVPAPPRSGTLMGKVTDAITGVAIPDPQVVAFKSDWAYFNLSTGDTGGNYQMGVIPGSYTVDANAPGYTGLGPSGKYVSVGAGRTVWFNVSLMPVNGENVTLKGYVRDSVSSNPIQGAEIQTTNLFKQTNRTRSDVTGYYAIQIYPANTSLLFTAFQHAPLMDLIKPAIGQTVYWYNASLDPDAKRPVTDLVLSAGPNGPARKLTFSGWVNESYLQTATVNIGKKVWENATLSGYSIRRQHYNTSEGLILYDPVEMPLTWTAKDNATFAGEFNGTGKYGMLNGTLLLGSVQTGTSYVESPFFKDRYVVGGLHTNASDPQGNVSLGVFHKNGTLDFVFVSPGQQNRVVYPNDDPSARFGALNLTWYFRKSDMRPVGLSFTSDQNYTLPGLTLVPVGMHPTGRYAAFAEMHDYGQNAGFDIHEFDLDTVAPSANAGQDASIKDGDPVTFNGSASGDDVGVANHTWTFNDGASNVTLYGAMPTHSFLVPGNYTATLTVRDAALNSDTDTMVVMVAVRDRIAPVARAGGNLTVGIGKNATLNGSASSDNIGIVDHVWMVANGTANQTLSGAVVSVRFDLLGTFKATLEVRDAEGNLGSDDAFVTVVDDIAPTARAGPDVTVPAGTEVTLNASGSSDNVGVAQYRWLVDNGTGPKFLNGSVVKVRYDKDGSFLVGLRVQDAAGNNDTDSLTVTVTKVADTTPPIADAGPDQTVNQSVKVKLDGSGSSDNVLVTEYNWSFKEKGKDVFLSGASPERTFGVPGSYDITLTVKDAAGNSDADVVTVVVKDTEPPVAKVASNPSGNVKTGTKVDFSSSGSTDNVAVNAAATAWTVSKDGAKVASYTGENVSHTFASAGSYTVAVEVKDTAGNVGKASVVVTVADEVRPSDAGGPLLPLLLIALVVAGILIFIAMRRRKPKQPGDGADAGSSTEPAKEGAGAGPEPEAETDQDAEAEEEREAAAHKAAATIAMKKEPSAAAVEGGLNYLFLAPDPKNAYDAFSKLLADGRKGLVVSSTLPSKLEKLYSISGAKSIWLTEKAGEGRVVPTRLDFEIAKAVNDFFRANPGGVFLLDGVEYLISRNPTDKVAQFVKKVADTAGEGGGTFLVTLNPNAIPADPLGMLRKSFDKVNEAK